MSSELAHHDFETFSPVDLLSTGADVYSEHPDAEALCMAFRVPGKDVGIWTPLTGEPTEFLDWIENGGAIAAHNSYFEWCVWLNIISKKFPHWPQPRLEQFHDTMAFAHAAGLPGGLDNCAKALGMDQRKDVEGARIMKKLSKPRKWSDDRLTYTRWHYWDVPDEFDKLYQYCKQDVIVEEEIAKRLRPLNAKERQVWLADQRINRRGIRLDIKGIHDAKKLVKAEVARLNGEMSEATGGDVKAVTNVADLANFFTDCGWPVSSVDKEAISNILKKDSGAPDTVKAAARIRQEAGKSSTAKFTTMLKQVCRDGRARGQYVYHGATTGRWVSKGIQLQNLVRPGLKADDMARAIDFYFPRDDAATLLPAFGYGAGMDVVSWSIRGMLIPNPGCIFEGGDFSNIEGRTIAWLANEETKLDAFRDYDAGVGPDLYKLAYARSFGLDPSQVDDDQQRQTGKCQELGLGFGGGVGALRTMSATYRVSLADLAVAVKAASDPNAWAEAEKKRLFLQVEKGMHADLSPDIYTACRVLVDAWRVHHSNIKAFWKDVEECALSAVRYRGDRFTTQSGKITFVCGKGFLYMRLPSGRVFSYARPSLEWQKNFITDKPEQVLQYYAMGKDKNKRGGKPKFEAVRSYGGLLAQNATQATARDAQAEAVLRLEAAGHPVVLNTHDELRCEVPIEKADLKLCQELIETPPAWATGLPVAVECELMPRYHK